METDFWIVLAGCLIFALAFIAIFFKFQVSTGHSIFLGIGAILFSLPFIANFEWSKDGVKIETRSAAQAITEPLEKIRDQQGLLSDTMKDVNTLLERTVERVNELQKALANNNNIEIDPWNTPPIIQGNEFYKLKENLVTADKLNSETGDDIEALKNLLINEFNSMNDVTKGH